MKNFAENLLQQFYADIELIEDAYANDSFTYIAIRTPQGMMLLQGSLILNVLPRDFPPTLKTENVRAGHFPLSAIGMERKEFLAKAITGTIITPDGSLSFEEMAPGEYSGQYNAFHEYGTQTQSRLGLLSLGGVQINQYLDRTRIDWELRAAQTPYDGVVELLGEYQLGALRHVAGIEVAALPVASIDASSRINGESAKVVVRAAPTIDTGNIAFGFRLFDREKVTKRHRLAGSDVGWRLIDGRLTGEFEFSVPRAALIQGFVSYKGISQQHYWISDPDTFQNARRAAYEASDGSLEVLTDIIAKAEGKGQNAHNFEAGIEWLFWMLGFSPALLSASNRNTDASDILMCTPNGHFAVIEVTTGLPKAERKMPNLDARSEAIRRKLISSNNRNLRVLSILVTSKSREDIKSELPDTTRLGIHVITKEDIEKLIPRTLLPLNPEQVYEDAERSVRESKADQSNQLPLGLVQSMP